MTQIDDLKARDLMSSPVITVGQHTPLREAAQTLSEHHISGALVVDNAGAPAGVVSLFDIVSRLAGLERPAGAPGGFYRQAYPPLETGDEEEPLEPEEDALAEDTVGDVMATEIIHVAPESSIEEVARTMWKDRIHRVFVSGPDGPLGVISTMDLLGVLAKAPRRRRNRGPREHATASDEGCG
jgi:CBS domain-containing protein